MSAQKFGVDYAKRVANCKECRKPLPKDQLRTWRLVPNPFTTDSDHPTEMKNYFHMECLFETLKRCRATTAVIDSANCIQGWEDINDDERADFMDRINKLTEFRTKKFGDKIKPNAETSEMDETKAGTSSSEAKHHTSVQKHRASKKSVDEKEKHRSSTSKNESKNEKSTRKVEARESKKRSMKRKISESDGMENSPKIAKIEARKTNFDSFKMFCKLCDVIASVSRHSEKTAAVRLFVHKEGYDGDMYLLLKLLIPSADQRVYSLKAKQIIKLFSNIYGWNVEEVIDSYNKGGDVSITIVDSMKHIFQGSKRRAELTNQQIDKWLDELSSKSLEKEQSELLKKIAEMATPLELKYVIRLINKDLRIGAGAKHILEGLKKGAYDLYQCLRDLRSVVEKCCDVESDVTVPENSLVVGTPVKPMLAAPCRSVKQVMSKFPNDFFAEIKYDGERLQLHKNGKKFTFYSRSLKPSMDHKVDCLEAAVEEAFPESNSLIVDAEMLLVDTKTGKPLPFGTLGIHKKKQFADASVCLFVFDCIFYDGMNLLTRTLKERRDILKCHMTEVPNRILLSNQKLVKNGDCETLKKLIWQAIDDDLEGLVLKDIESAYEPGKRHWLKVKKDYLNEGSMADSADLIVLGAYYGTGSKGGMMSVFLMGVHDSKTDCFLTVTKCGNGFDDAALNRINKELRPKMQKISRTYENLPGWIQCSRSLVPDFIVMNPKDSPVWEIAGAEFSQSTVHSAGGISIRFPRLTKIRDDKNWETATSLIELKDLFATAKSKSDISTSSESAEIPLYARGDIPASTDDSNDRCPDEEIIKEESENKSVTHDEPNESDHSKVVAINHDPSSDERSSTEKETKPNKTPCKYGAKCYRDNDDHSAKYSHPPKVDD